MYVEALLVALSRVVWLGFTREVEVDGDGDDDGGWDGGLARGG